VSAAIALAFSFPVRVRQYAGGLTSMRREYTEPAARAGIDHGLILIRESWGAQIIARLWGLGIPHSETETLYRGVDTCVLEVRVSQLERGGVRGPPALAALTPLLGDSSRVVESQLSPDKTERVLPGLKYEPICAQRIFEDRAGYTFLAPVLASKPGSNVYARDLHGRDTLLFRAFPGRPIYVLRAVSSDLGAPLRLAPLSLDSARAEWRAAGSF
jgi:hypothetical protein